MTRTLWRPPRKQWLHHATNRIPFVQDIIPKNGVGAELGVYCGDFTSILLAHAEPAVLHLVDPWFTLADDWTQWGVLGPTTRQAHAMVEDRYAPDPRVRIHVADDVDWLRTLPDGVLDWCYIDTVHEYLQCATELALLHSKMKPGGIICGDDWSDNPDHPFYGVYQAVNDFCHDNDYTLIYANDSNDDAQWAICEN